MVNTRRSVIYALLASGIFVILFKVSEKGQRRSPTQCRTMASDVIRLYISLISQFFTLSDMAVISSESGHGTTVPPFVPQSSNSLTTAYYLARILSEIQDCANEVLAMDISPDANSGMKSLLESTRWRFEGALTGVWLRGLYQISPLIIIMIIETSVDANLFHYLETWASDPAHETTTIYLNQMQAFQRHLTTEAFKIAGGLDLNPSTSKPIRQHRIAANFTSKITKSFLDSLYAYLDGLVHLASEDSEYTKPAGGEPSNGFLVNRGDLIDLANPVSTLLQFYVGMLTSSSG